MSEVRQDIDGRGYAQLAVGIPGLKFSGRNTFCRLGLNVVDHGVIGAVSWVRKYGCWVTFGSCVITRLAG